MDTLGNNSNSINSQDDWLTCAELATHLVVSRTMARRIASSCYAGHLYKGRLFTVKKSSTGGLSHFSVLSICFASALCSLRFGFSPASRIPIL
jgi:hypothetical protein